MMMMMSRLLTQGWQGSTGDLPNSYALQLAALSCEVAALSCKVAALSCEVAVRLLPFPVGLLPFPVRLLFGGLWL